MTALLLALLAPSHAATLTTCGDSPVLGCYGTLQEAIDAGADGDIVAVTAGTYRESVAVAGKSLTLQGGEDVYLLGSGEPAIAVLDLSSAIVSLYKLTIASELQRPIRIDQSSLFIEMSSLRGGAFQTRGGIVFATDSSLSFDRSTVRHGVAIDGGLIALERSTLGAGQTSFSDGIADLDGGAIYAADPDSSVQLARLSTVTNNAAKWGGGVSVDNASSLDILGSLLTNNAADSGGGAVAAVGTPLTVSDTTMTGNTASLGGAITTASADFTLTQSYLCDNHAGSGSAVHVASSNSTITNTTFFRNQATDESALQMSGTPDTTLVAYNDFIANSAAAFAAATLPAGTTVFSANVVSHHTNRTQGSEPAVTWPRTTADLTATHNLYFDNAGREVAIELRVNAVSQAPMLRSLDPNIDCGLLLPRVFWGSPTIDAGPPSATDPDGSVADIGALGGPGAVSGHWNDSDQDGWPAAYDCSDGDDAFNPDQVDTPYDGVDQNCDGWDDYDSDHDGYTAEGYGGDDCDDNDPDRHPGAFDSGLDLIDQDCDDVPERDHDGDGYDGVIHEGGTDCDDSDPRVHPGAVDASDFADVDCDGIRSSQESVIPQSCAHTPPGMSLLWCVPLLLVRRREGR